MRPRKRPYWGLQEKQKENGATLLFGVKGLVLTMAPITPLDPHHDNYSLSVLRYIKMKSTMWQYIDYYAQTGTPKFLKPSHPRKRCSTL